MGLSRILMAPTIFLTIFSLLFISADTHEEGFISVEVSDVGLEFVKDLLINKAISSLTPLELPPIEKSKKIPVVGNVHMNLTNITIYEVSVSSSSVKTGVRGLDIVALNATANINMNWRYSYRTWLVPVEITDKGNASVQVEGMQLGLIVGLKNQQGTLRLSVVECNCRVGDISIDLDGGASWLYQTVVDAFEGKLKSAVQDAFSEKLREQIKKFDALLRKLPKQIRLTRIATLNVTLVNDIVLGKSSIDFDINGLFIPTTVAAVSKYHRIKSESLESCTNFTKMAGLSIREDVINSALEVYFNANTMHWTIDKFMDQSFLNTAGWMYFVPELYRQYPNDDMTLHFAISSPPRTKISEGHIDITMHSDLNISVLDDGQPIPVACLSQEMTASGSVGIIGNNVTASVQLDDFTLSLKWSKVGELKLSLIQVAISRILNNIIVPLLNFYLERGYQLPTIHGMMFQDAEILCTNSTIMICSDVAFPKWHHTNLLSIFYQ
ncbi:Lipid-binding serum glycoprotein, C-terminal [Dillenia turbinata]|uniref:Lipid-binding serum glycoprotein, C-terminal n=1 Tax=Dillenia turbinata TaxID=194707 RepID=A0AAN8ZE76_9MAGN